MTWGALHDGRVWMAPLLWICTFVRLSKTRRYRCLCNTMDGLLVLRFLSGVGRSAVSGKEQATGAEHSQASTHQSHPTSINITKQYPTNSSITVTHPRQALTPRRTTNTQPGSLPSHLHLHLASLHPASSPPSAIGLPACMRASIRSRL